MTNNMLMPHNGAASTLSPERELITVGKSTSQNVKVRSEGSLAWGKIKKNHKAHRERSGSDWFADVITAGLTHVLPNTGGHHTVRQLRLAHRVVTPCPPRL